MKHLKRRWKTLSIVVAAVFLFFAGRYTGYRSAERSRIVTESASGSETVTLVPNPKGEYPTEATDETTASKPEEAPRPKRLRVEEMPSAYLKSFLEAEDFANRLPEIEREFLAQNPLYSKALEIEARMKEQNDLDYESEDSKKMQKLWEEWHETPGNSLRLFMRRLIQWPDAYLSIMDDPQLAPFIENRLITDGSGSIANQFRADLHETVGFSMEGVDPIDEGITDLAEFRGQFQRFADQLTSVPENQFALDPLPPHFEKEIPRMIQKILRRRTILQYRHEALPDSLSTDRIEHGTKLSEISRRLGWRTPLEVFELRERIRKSDRLKY